MDFGKRTIIALFLTAGAFQTATAGGDGAALYKHHCLGCHPDVARLKPRGDMYAVIRNAPPGMPSFGGDRLPDPEAKTLIAYMLSDGIGTSPTAHAQPEAQPRNTPAASPPAAPALPTAPAVRQSERAPEKKPPPEDHVRSRKREERGFVRKWTIKRMPDGVPLESFEILEDPNRKLQAVAFSSLADYSVRTTRFQVSGKTMQVQFTWTWKRSSSSWRTETYDLALSGADRLSGTCEVRTSSDHTSSMAVWGE